MLRSNISVEQLLDQTAKRGTWYGGGSAAALACALAAALLEKLASRPGAAESLRTIRTRCTKLIEEDAHAFARVIQAHMHRDRQAVRRALKVAIEVPAEVCTASQRLLTAAARIRPTLTPAYTSDLRCAVALARASGQAAQALVKTNLEWLDDRAYSRRIRRVLSQRT